MIALRKASLDDLPLLLKMEAEYARDQRLTVIRRNARLTPYMARRPVRRGARRDVVKQETARNFRKWIRGRNSLVSIAELDSCPAGFSVIFIEASPPLRRLRKVGYISIFFVRRSYRGRGICSLMMQHASDWFVRRKIQHIGLMVIEDNTIARAIYRKWGFFDFFVEMRKKLEL